MKSDLHDLKKTHFMDGKEVQSSGDQQNLITKIYGSKENDSEIDFEEEPRTALMASQNNEETYQESDDNYLLPKQLKRKKKY
jgi:hypothetical protein